MSSEDHLRETQEAFEELDPHWIDIESLRLWLSTCDQNHGANCRQLLTPDNTVGTQPQWLVDVRHKCLTPAKQGDRYAALSYVWGDTATTPTTTTNLSQLREHGSLLSSEVTLPKTIRHTIALLEQLDIPYLWLDVLCIVQDVEDVKRKQIHAMAWIYANAYVTIIAADGSDADHGLVGIRGVTGPRQLHSNSVSAIDTSLKNHAPKWYTRGWTFQELTFSRRRIMFHKEVALWECPRASWNESHLNSVFNIPRWPVQLHLSAWPDIRHYLNAVRSYNTRQFTFPQDALNAISGLFSVWRHAFDGGFISGLPQMFFHEALLWQPEDELKRRVSTVDPNDTSPLPSWSWIGWEGPIDIETWASHFSHMNHHRIYSSQPFEVCSYQVIPTVDWFFYDPDQGDMVPIDASSSKYRPKTRAGQVLPRGWRLLNSALPLYGFEDIEEARAAYPLPLLSPPGSLVPASLLYCNTKRGFFKADRYKRHRYKGICCDEIFLLDKTGTRMGMLRVNSRSFYVDELVQNPLLELIEIAGGEIPHSSWITTWGVFNPDPNSRTYDSAPWPIVYVLWIEWIEGVAYRKGLSRVLAEPWKRDASDEVDLILG
ncbi:heterokaryon incompatibility protein-domain-containing protein [Hypoxylon crocopeplum]|nr:heterokaryon incompatibility protein-domain-containing protein [Hypoxylon crocopeplum]